MNYVNLSFQFKMKTKKEYIFKRCRWRFNLSNDGFDFKNWPLDPKSYRAFRETGPRSENGGGK